jgi:hypothetical protein
MSAQSPSPLAPPSRPSPPPMEASFESAETLRTHPDVISAGTRTPAPAAACSDGPGPAKASGASALTVVCGGGGGGLFYPSCFFSVARRLSFGELLDLRLPFFSQRPTRGAVRVLGGESGGGDGSGGSKLGGEECLRM